MAMNPRLLRPLATFDQDAAAYLRAVEAADGQALETPVKRAVDDFFRGTKADGNFGALKSAALLCGARTLAGALVPLVGAAPTNYNFVDADYNRETGLVGNGSTKYLDSNYILPSANQNDCHATIYINQLGVGSQCGADTASSSQRFFLYSDSTQTIASLNNANKTLSGAGSTESGFFGASRAASSGYTARAEGNSYAITAASSSVAGNSFYVYAVNRNNALQGSPVASRLSFYSFGSAISDLAAFDARVTDLVTSIGAAL